MASLTYTNLETRVANALRVPTTNTTEMTKVQAMINMVYRDIAAKKNWWWLFDRQVINTSDDITTGTVAVTNDSTTITFSSAPSVSVTGYMFTVPGNTTDSGAVYRVSSHTAAATTATLDAAYTGATATAASYKLYKDTYSLASDTGKVLSIKRYGYRQPLRIISPQEMHDLKAYDTSEGKPELACPYNFATSGDPTTVRQLIVHPYPDATYRLEIHYKQSLNTEVSSTTRFLIPDDYINVLYYGALARGYVIFLNDSTRGNMFLDLFNQTLALMAIAQMELAEDRPSVAPRDDYRSFYADDGISSLQADLGSLFDRYPMGF